MALTVTDNSVRQINAALLSLEKEINETNSEKAQDKQIVQVELKNVQYSFLAPLRQNGTSVSIDTTGTWQGNANSATTASSASTALNADHATTADTATTATNADISKTLDTVNGDKLQIGTGTAINVTNAQHAASADSASSATTATSASNANISKTLDTTNGDKLQIGTGTAINVTNAQHAATATTTTNANLSITSDTTNGDKIQIGTGTAVNITNSKHAATADAFKSAYSSTITPAQGAAMSSGSTTWPLAYNKNYLQTVTVSWDDYQLHTFPAGASGMFFPGYSSNGGTLVLVDYPASRMLYNVWIDSTRWSGWHYIDLATVSYT